jgi:hypothetical protein
MARVTAKTITNAQIWQLREALNRIDNMFAICDIASGLREPSPKARTQALRSVENAKRSCARAWNTRFAGKDESAIPPPPGVDAGAQSPALDRPPNAGRLAADIFRARAEEAGMRVGPVETSAPDEDGHVRVTAEVTIDAADIAEQAEAERAAESGGALCR